MVQGDEPVLRADNKGYRYGDGLFETMKVVNQVICLEEYHWQRLFSGLQLLQFTVPPGFTPVALHEQVLSLCEANGCDALARVRLSVSRGSGGLYDDSALQYIIECQPADEAVNRFHMEGVIVGMYHDACKSCDLFSGLKSANYLTYVMAAKYAKQKGYDDCLVQNQYGRIADATIANVFLVKEGRIFTPAAGEGCIQGVMRSYLIEKCRNTQYAISERPITHTDVEEADELFLTNALYGIRRVRQLGDKQYGYEVASELYDTIVKTIWDKDC